ncbi:MAG: hypothetical protein ACLRTF_06010 [Blautia sp.]
MNEQKRLGIVVAATVVFGIFSKWLVGVPYMAWGYFDKMFVTSFLLWCFYAAALYIAAKLETGKKLNLLKIVVQALAFGVIAAFMKIGIDAGIEQCAKKINNMLYVTILMECGIILFGILIMLFLHIYVAKNRKIRRIGFNKLLGLLMGIVTLYAGVMGYYLYQVKHWISEFSHLEMIQDIGIAQGVNNLSTKYAIESNLIGMIVYVAFFITFWSLLQKSAEDSHFTKAGK